MEILQAILQETKLPLMNKNSNHGNTPMIMEPVNSLVKEQLNPEFLDAPGLQKMYGIKRGLAYRLLADGKIQGVSLRQRGKLRGKRLFVVDSVRKFLKSQMEKETLKQDFLNQGGDYEK